MNPMFVPACLNQGKIGAGRVLTNRTPKCFATPAVILLAIALLQSTSFAQSETSKLTVDELKAKAETGDAAAECQLGLRYVRGDGVPKDYAEAVKWIRKSAEHGDAEGQHQLGNAYFSGKGVEKDDTQAFQWNEKSARQGNVAAETALGVCYEFAHGVEQNFSEANDWYRKAAALNNAQAQNNLGNNMMQGRGIGKDVVQGYKWILLSAAQGNSYAIKSVDRYESRLTPAQLSQARGLAEAFRAADLSGSTTSLKPLPTASRSVAENATPTPSRKSSPGNILGLEPLPTAAPSPAVAQNPSPAPPQYGGPGNVLGVGQLPTPPPMSNYPWQGQQATSGSLQERAEAGDAEAQYELGMAYIHGDGVAKNYSQAAKWLHKAAEQGHAVAQYNLGVCFANGAGTAKNMAQACKWYLKSAEQNYPQAEYNLGCSYLSGQGVRKNGAEAFKWFLKAAEQSDADGQANVGYCYMNGIGVQRDDIQAYKWAAIAAARGNEKAREYLDTLNSRMSRAAIAQARQQAQEFRPNEGGGDQAAPNPEQPPPSQTGPLRPHNTGTGFFITQDGYVITNNHVVQDGAAVQLVTRHAKVVATVVEVDAGNDLALLKAEGEYTALPVGSSFDVKLGDTVSTIGFPLIDLQGVSPKFTRGEISSLAGFKDDVRFFQMSTQIQPGNSGGALVDEHGNVIGVTSATLTASGLFKSRGVVPENVNYAIKSYVLSDFLKWALRKAPGKLVPPNTDQDKPSDVIDRMKDAAVLVVVYTHGSQ